MPFSTPKERGMTYEEAMQFWFGRVNYEQKSPHVGDFKLERMRSLLHVLGNPQDRLRIVHIAGSKGKGSTSAMLASILQHDGYHVGLFTSPHLEAVEERIQINGRPIDKNHLTDLLEEIRDRAPASLQSNLTFFEIGTALGFLHFERSNVDFAIVEVGLGGRFDSTNVCDPLISIITSISFDHTQILGNTLAKIAFEKAGIIKPGRPTISGVRNAEPRVVIDHICKVRGAPLKQIDIDFCYEYQPAIVDLALDSWPTVVVTTARRTWQPMKVALIGEHQARNAAIAVTAVESLAEQGFTISDRAVFDGLQQVQWPARLEIMSHSPLLLLDCAHNVASAQALAQAIRETFPMDGKRLLIFGGNRDKDVAGMLNVLAPLFDRIALTAIQGSARSMAPAELAPLVPKEKASATTQFADAWQALCWAEAETAHGRGMICVTGSVFLAGELRPRIPELFGR